MGSFDLIFAFHGIPSFHTLTLRREIQPTLCLSNSMNPRCFSEDVIVFVNKRTLNSERMRFGFYISMGSASSALSFQIFAFGNPMYAVYCARGSSPSSSCPHLRLTSTNRAHTPRSGRSMVSSSLTPNKLPLPHLVSYCCIFVLWYDMWVGGQPQVTLQVYIVRSCKVMA